MLFICDLWAPITGATHKLSWSQQSLIVPVIQWELLLLNDTFTLDNTAKKVDGGAGTEVLSFAYSTAGVIVNDSTKTGNIVAQNLEE